MLAVNTANPMGTRGDVAHAYAALLRQLWRRDLVAVAPQPFRTAIGRHLPQFAAAEQQDNQEFLLALLDKLHEDLNQVGAAVMSRRRCSRGSG
jgi:ubiquitin carboxyl-terminal hydrolase 8